MVMVMAMAMVVRPTLVHDARFAFAVFNVGRNGLRLLKFDVKDVP